jgi:hypothetical protein
MIVPHMEEMIWDGVEGMENIRNNWREGMQWTNKPPQLKAWTYAV